MRKVMIGTPCLYGQLDVWYTNSLVNTIKMANDLGDIEIVPIWISFDALLQRARNDTLHAAIEGDFDDLIWIDSDIEWEPSWFFKLLEYPVDVVGGTYRKKGDKEEYVLRQFQRKPPNPETGLIEVDGLGTGFVRFSKNAIQALWNTCQPYIDPKDNKERRMAFHVSIMNDSLVSEDIYAFIKLQEAGIKLWLDPAMTCNHTGAYKFQGNFARWYNSTEIKPIRRQL